MAASQTEIVNSALQKCAETKIENIDQDVKAAREAKTAWDMTRRSCLTMYRWNFAKRRAQLAASATGPAFGWTYQFPVPADFLSLIGVYGDSQYQQNYTDSQDYFVQEGTDSSTVILSESSPLYITYIKNITDTARFDPLFDEVMACHLALRLVYPLSTSSDRVSDIQKELIMWENRAKFSNAIQNSPEIFQASTWLDARFQGDNDLRRGPVV